eukprot:CAMPEP_0181513134 /NCGR_PEP_ID=MMETSP1110-20121109/62339_1 /TAXON_ID=174948 /ORGANISM="Symbiodinium sp., Strain CCMP421" /LENGTH=34 /DNA_ID=CAMNT_0023642985 /DNA_START=68 /DNA_END=172 /DNA_ORIENTATION=+
MSTSSPKSWVLGMPSIRGTVAMLAMPQVFLPNSK